MKVIENFVARIYVASYCDGAKHISANFSGDNQHEWIRSLEKEGADCGKFKRSLQ